MTMTTTLAEADGGTDVLMLHEGIPPGVSVTDNELGTRMSLDKLATVHAPAPWAWFELTLASGGVPLPAMS
jgi:hypothetical protein